MGNHGYLGEWVMLACKHLAEWVQTKPVDMTDFRGKSNPTPEYGLGIFQHLQDSYSLGQESIIVIPRLQPLFMT